jgi:hypothetical protein
MCFGIADRNLGTGDTGADELRPLAQHANIDLRIDSRDFGADPAGEDNGQPHPTKSSHFAPSFRSPPYLKEPKFRSWHRTGDLFDQAANNLCDLSPKPDGLPYLISFAGSFMVFWEYFRC